MLDLADTLESDAQRPQKVFRRRCPRMRTPIRGSRGCCARAPSGQPGAVATHPRSWMNCRRLTRPPHLRSQHIPDELAQGRSANCCAASAVGRRGLEGVRSTRAGLSDVTAVLPPLQRKVFARPETSRSS